MYQLLDFYFNTLKIELNNFWKRVYSTTLDVEPSVSIPIERHHQKYHLIFHQNLHSQSPRALCLQKIANHHPLQIASTEWTIPSDV